MLVWLSLYPQLATTPQLCPRVNILTTGTNCQLKKPSKSLITELLHTYQHIHDITQKDPSHMSFQTGSPRAVAHRNDKLSLPSVKPVSPGAETAFTPITRT